MISIKVFPLKTGAVPNVNVPIEAPGASVPRMVVAPVTVPLPWSVWLAPSTNDEAMPVTLRVAPLLIEMLVELAMELPPPNANAPPVMMVGPV